MRYFIFLEFLDPKVESTLRELRDAIQPSIAASGPVHVTLRGPYRKKPDRGTLLDMGQRLKGHGVRIIGAGIFSTPEGYAVFLRAESAAFRELWWKPDFNTPIDDIQPHLTVYESQDEERALLALNFLKAARISILTYSVQLTVYRTGQRDLFGKYALDAAPPNPSRRQDIVVIDPETLPGARRLGLQLAQMASSH